MVKWRKKAIFYDFLPTIWRYGSNFVTTKNLHFRFV